MLLKSQRLWSQTNPHPNLSYYGAWLEGVDDKDLREAMIAANINIVRREAPFVYFFASGNGQNYRLMMSTHSQEYQSSLDTRPIGRGMWLSDPDWEGLTTTTVTAVLIGDVLPFVYFLDDDKYGLFCSPHHYSIEEINKIVGLATSNKNAVEALLLNGGCVISVIDYQNFSLKTFDNSFSKYFTTD